MPDLRVQKCPKCGNIFTRDRRNVCSECYRAEQEMLDKVRRHLDENPGATAPEIAEGTGVPEKEIIRMIKEGHLITPAGHKISYACDACGKPISSGRFCPDCGGKLTKGLEGEIKRLRGRPADEDSGAWKKTEKKEGKP